MEIWKEHPDINNLLVSTYGRIKTNDNKRIGISKDPSGYLRASVKIRNQRKWRRIHQLVMDTFKPQPMAGLVIDHIDDNRENNRLDNLRWVTNKENLQKAADQGRMNHGGSRKPIVSIDENGLADYWESSAQASKTLKIGDYTIARVLSGMQIEARTKNHSYRFHYIRS